MNRKNTSLTYGRDCPPGFNPLDGVDSSEEGRFMGSHVQPLLLADWERALFLHFVVSPEELQRQVPFKLDLFEGRRAMVSLVAFTMRDMRFRRGGRWMAWLTRPIATHSVLNLRTYVRGNNGEPGIFLVREWLNSKLAAKLGAITFGLPYRYAELTYLHHFKCGEVSGTVHSNQGRLIYRAAIANSEFKPCRKGSLDAFLLERYTAFTRFPLGIRAFFRVWHPPWAQVPVTDLEIEDRSILSGLFTSGSSFVGANFSPGCRDVWMGRPRLPGSRDQCAEAQFVGSNE